MGLDKILLISMLGDGSLVLPYRCRLVIHQVQHAGLFAESGANAPRELGKIVGLREQRVGFLPVSAVKGVVPLGCFVVQWAGPVAERHATVHATAGLQSAVVAVKGMFNLAKVVYSVVYRPVACFLSLDL